MEVLYFLQLPLNYFSYMFKTTKVVPGRGFSLKKVLLHTYF